MPHFQLLGGHVAIGGDTRHVVPRDVDNPMTFPEVAILQYVHGHDAVTDLYEVGFVERDYHDERQRLVGIYGEKPLADVYAGSVNHLPLKGDYPTWEDVKAAREASAEMLRKRREKRNAAANAGRRPPAVEVEVANIGE